jgi:hypothetical protein
LQINNATFLEEKTFLKKCFTFRFGKNAPFENDAKIRFLRKFCHQFHQASFSYANDDKAYHLKRGKEL